MSLATVLGFLSVILAGMLAGMEFVIHHGVRGPADTLDDRAQLQLRQALVLRLRVLIPAFFVPTAVFGIAVTALEWTAPGWWFRIVGLLALLIWIGIRVIGTVPINSATVSWRLEAPPKNWKGLIKRAERFHIVGVWAVILAFALFLAAFSLTLIGS